MSVVLSWEDQVWIDPDGGRIVFHAVLPTVVYPRAMRPRAPWDGLALLAGEEDIDAWEFEEKSEKESAGINLTEAMLGGGATQLYLERLMLLEEVSGGRFPDPEPWRMLRLAKKHDRPVYHLEPPMDDDEWVAHLEREADQLTRWRTLLKIPRQGRRFSKLLKIAKVASSPPSDGPMELQVASALAASWWWLLEESLSPELSLERDQRIVARLRGAIADLRSRNGDDATLMVPSLQVRIPKLIELLESGVEPETANGGTTSDGEEE